MKALLILCGVLNGLGALFWLVSAIGNAGGGIGGGLAATLQLYFASSCFGGVILCGFGAAVLDMMAKQREQFDRIIRALDLIEQRSAPSGQEVKAAEPHPRSWEAIRDRRQEPRL